MYGEPFAWHSALQAAATESDSFDPYAVEFAAGLIWEKDQWALTQVT